MNWTLKPTKEINGETTVEKNTNGWKDGWMAKWTKLTKMERNSRFTFSSGFRGLYYSHSLLNHVLVCTFLTLNYPRLKLPWGLHVSISSRVHGRLRTLSNKKITNLHFCCSASLIYTCFATTSSFSLSSSRHSCDTQPPQPTYYKAAILKIPRSVQSCMGSHVWRGASSAAGRRHELRISLCRLTDFEGKKLTRKYLAKSGIVSQRNILSPEVWGKNSYPNKIILTTPAPAQKSNGRPLRDCSLFMPKGGSVIFKQFRHMKNLPLPGSGYFKKLPPPPPRLCDRPKM